VATAACAAETLVLGDGIGDLGKVEDLMPGRGFCIDHDLTPAGAPGIREMSLDLIDRGLGDEITGVGDMARLSAALSARRLAWEAVFWLSCEAILARRERRIARVEFELFETGLKVRPEFSNPPVSIVHTLGSLRHVLVFAGQIHAIIVSPDFFSDFLPLSVRRGNHKLSVRAGHDSAHNQGRG
jgi:hypothetical protein